MAAKRATRIGFVGDKTSIEFFKLFSADIFPASTLEEAEKLLNRLSLEDYSVIFITEEVFDRQVFSGRLMEKKILPIPSLVSNEGKGYKIVEELIRKATGMKD